MFHGDDLVHEWCNEAWAGAKALGWHFVIQTKREYKRGEQCWLENGRGVRVDVRPEKIQTASGTYLVQFGTLITDEWESAE
jgi:hypothetical protein